MMSAVLESVDSMIGDRHTYLSIDVSLRRYWSLIRPRSRKTTCSTVHEFARPSSTIQRTGMEKCS